jgi:hypothetical protein
MCGAVGDGLSRNREAQRKVAPRSDVRRKNLRLGQVLKHVARGHLKFGHLRDLIAVQ